MRICVINSKKLKEFFKVSKKNKNSVEIPEHILELIRVDPAETQKLLDSLKTKAYPPSEEVLKKKKKRGQLYCPYCRDYRKFKPIKKKGYVTYPRCVECGISNEDFYVKTYNNLWGGIGK